MGDMETYPTDKASEASESCSDSTRPTSLAMTEAPPDDQMSEEWEQCRNEHDMADKEEELEQADEERAEKIEAEHICQKEQQAGHEEGFGLQADNLPSDEPVTLIETITDLVETIETAQPEEEGEEEEEEEEDIRAAHRAKLLSGPWDEVLDDEDDPQVVEYGEHVSSPWERLLTQHWPAPERIEEGDEEEAEEVDRDEEVETDWGPHWNEDQHASSWSRGWGAESENESLSDGWMVPFDELIHNALGSCFNSNALPQPMPLAHAAGVFDDHAVCIWSTSASGGVDGPSSTDGDDIPKEVFTNGQQVFKQVPSADGQTLFTDGARLYASVCVVMGPPSTDVAKSDGNFPLHQPGQLESQLRWSEEASDDENWEE